MYTMSTITFIVMMSVARKIVVPMMTIYSRPVMELTKLSPRPGIVKIFSTIRLPVSV